MTIQERMVARSEREKDLLKYGCSQERERIIKLLEGYEIWPTHEHEATMMVSKFDAFVAGFSTAIALIKGEQNG